MRASPIDPHTKHKGHRKLAKLGRLAIVCATALAVAPLSAVDPTGTAVAAGADTPTPLTEKTVQEFLDRRVPELLKRYDIPGAGVSVVADGRKLASDGYGYADLEKKKPVRAGSTAFRTASIGKSFTAAAVLQLVEKGRLDLRTDVNTYLPEDLEIRDTYRGKPVTLHHLLTHTAGFEETMEGVAYRDADDVPSLRTYLREHQPNRSHPPGRFTAYSNYGMSLAGFIVQEVSGTPFSKYANRNIFGRLGMRHSAFAGTDRAAERLDVPTGYVRSGTENVPSTELHQPLMPAGSAFATVDDMSSFMLALLNGGATDGKRMLGSRTTTDMLTRHAGNDPRLPGLGYGVHELPSEGARAVGHGGDFAGAHTLYTLVPEKAAGIYLAVNGDGKRGDPSNEIRNDLVNAFFSEFFGMRLSPGGKAPSGGPSNAPVGRYQGTYVTTRTSHTEPAGLNATQAYLTVTGAGDGALRIAGARMGDQRWTQVEPGLFRSADGKHRLAFMEDEGKVIGVAAGDQAAKAFSRVSWHEKPMVHVVVAGAGLALLASVVLWPVTALVRRLRRRDTTAFRGGARYARLLAATTALVVAGFATYMASLFADETKLTQQLGTGSPTLTVPLAIAAVLTPGVLACAVLCWSRGWWASRGGSSTRWWRSAPSPSSSRASGTGSSGCPGADTGGGPPRRLATPFARCGDGLRVNRQQVLMG